MPPLVEGVSNLRILCLTLLYPLLENPARGVFVRDRVELLREMGHEVKVANPLPRMMRMNEARRSTLTGVATAAIYSEEGEVFHPRFTKLPSDPMPLLTRISIRRLARKVERWMGEWRPEAISCHTIWPMAELAEKLAKRWQIPWWVCVHGHDYDVGLKDRSIAKHIRRLSASADGVVCVSERLKAEAEELGLPNPPVCIPCHVNVGDEWAQPMRRWGGRWRRGLLDILFPADARRPEKRYVLALKACTELEQRGWQVKIGNLAQVPRQLVFDRMVTCHICLITSSREAGPIVAREAITCGLPVVSVDVGDLATWLPNRCIATQETPVAIADAIEATLDGGVEDFIVPEKFTATAVQRALSEHITQLLD